MIRSKLLSLRYLARCGVRGLWAEAKADAHPNRNRPPRSFSPWPAGIPWIETLSRVLLLRKIRWQAHDIQLRWGIIMWLAPSQTGTAPNGMSCRKESMG